MRSKLIVSILALAALAGCATEQPARHNYVHWEKSYQAALQKAQKTDKVVFMYFWTEWCIPCRTVDDKVFTNPTLGPAVAQYVNLKVNAEKGNGPALARRYEVYAYPTFLFVNADGEAIGRIKGTRPEKAWLTAINSMGHNDPFADKLKALRQHHSDKVTVITRTRKAPAHLPPNVSAVSVDTQSFFRAYVKQLVAAGAAPTLHVKLPLAKLYAPSGRLVRTITAPATFKKLNLADEAAQDHHDNSVKLKLPSMTKAIRKASGQSNLFTNGTDSGVHRWTLVVLVAPSLSGKDLHAFSSGVIQFKHNHKDDLRTLVVNLK